MHLHPLSALRSRLAARRAQQGELAIVVARAVALDRVLDFRQIEGSSSRRGCRRLSVFDLVDKGGAGGEAVLLGAIVEAALLEAIGEAALLEAIVEAALLEAIVEAASKPSSRPSPL